MSSSHLFKFWLVHLIVWVFCNSEREGQTMSHDQHTRQVRLNPTHWLLGYTFFCLFWPFILLLFEQVPSLLFAPHHLLALFTLGVPSGLVLDCGLTETVVLPISFCKTEQKYCPVESSGLCCRSTHVHMLQKRFEG